MSEAPPERRHPTIDLAERILQLLDQGRFTATYKYAVLLALIDVCLENVSASGAAPETITTRQLADKLIELYWPQARSWPTGRLRQSGGTRVGDDLARLNGLLRPLIQHQWAVLVARLSKLDEYERRAGGDRGCRREIPRSLLRLGNHARGRATCTTARLRAARAVRRVEAHRDASPASSDDRQRDAAVPVHDRLVQRDRPENRHPLPARRIGPVRQPDHAQGRLEEFLFGVSRASLDAVREPLRELQSDRCFFCRERLADGRGRRAVVDHFIPWARHPDDGIENLVVTHEECNGQKREFLAAAPHVAAWAARAASGSPTADGH